MWQLSCMVCLWCCHLQGPAVWRALLDASSNMLLALRQLLQEKNLPRQVQEELSVFSGGTLHHLGQLLAHRLMFNATLVVSPNGRHLQRLLLAGSCLADILNGERWLQFWRALHCGQPVASGPPSTQPPNRALTELWADCTAHSCFKTAAGTCLAGNVGSYKSAFKMDKEYCLCKRCIHDLVHMLLLLFCLHLTVCRQCRSE